MSNRRFPWVSMLIACLLLMSPIRRFFPSASWGAFGGLVLGGMFGFGLAHWLRNDLEEGEEGEDAILRHRLAVGDLRLSEYRILRRELGLEKMVKKTNGHGQEISAGS
jgi:hypothetical protein